MTETKLPDLQATIARAKREVLRDIAGGTVPTTVDNYGDLHTYVDANYYGGAFEQTCMDPNTGEIPDDHWKFWNDVQNAVHEWLKAGRPS